MFPTFVWKAELKPDVHKRINGNILTKLDQLRETLPELAPGQAWQSDQSLHELDEFHELVACVNDTSHSVLKFLKIGCDTFRITALWANVLMPRAGHRMHSHPNNFLSGVYYVHPRRSGHRKLPRSKVADRDHQAARNRTHRRKYGSSRRGGQERHPSPVPCLVATFGRCQQHQEGTNKHQFQYHAGFILRGPEQTALVDAYASLAEPTTAVSLSSLF